MAGFDYIDCSECGTRLIYDGDFHIREYLETPGKTKGITCDKCVDKLKKKIENLEIRIKKNKRFWL